MNTVWLSATGLRPSSANDQGAPPFVLEPALRDPAAERVRTIPGLDELVEAQDSLQEAQDSLQKDRTPRQPVQQAERLARGLEART